MKSVDSLPMVLETLITNYWTDYDGQPEFENLASQLLVKAKQIQADSWRAGSELPPMGIDIELKFVGDRNTQPVVINGETVGHIQNTYKARRNVLADSYSPSHLLLDIVGAEHPQEVNTKTFYWRVL